MTTLRVCETCGSENIRSVNGSVGFCEDCDAVCTVIEPVCTCGGVIDTDIFGDYGCIGGVWFCQDCI